MLRSRSNSLPLPSTNSLNGPHIPGMLRAALVPTS
jgi:hypothetical protein